MSIFRMYDIRGVYPDDIDETVARKIGVAFSKVAKDKIVVVAADNRTSSPALKGAFMSGVFQKHMIDIGIVPISAALHAAWKNNATLSYITASHLGKENNGMKFYHSSTIGFSDEEIQEIGRHVIASGLSEGQSADIAGGFSFGKSVDGADSGWHPEHTIETVNSLAVIESYVKFLSEKIRSERPLDVIIDSGNGATCFGISDLFKACGFEVDSIFDEPDGNFPNRNPDPIHDELTELRTLATNYDFGAAFDGDGDRIVIVDDKGRKLSSEQMSFVILNELLKHATGDVAANMEINMLIDKIAGSFGRKVIRFPVGHTFLSETVQRCRAAYGIEISGHGAIPSIAPFNDSVVLGLYFGYALSKMDEKLSDIVNRMPKSFTERKNYECADDRKFEVIDALRKKFSEEYADVNVSDGVRVNLENGWVLIRASNTEPKIRITAEADTENEAKKLFGRFCGVLEEEIENI